jgi:hypothetical protein
LTQELKPHRFLARKADGGEEFARAAIESKDAVTGAKPQYMGQVMALVAVELDGSARHERACGMKARCSEVVICHRPFPFAHEPLKKPESGVILPFLRPGLS